MELSRRDLIKLGAFGTAALVLPAERLARTQLAQANRIAQSALPKPFTLPFKLPPVLAPVRTSADTDFFQLTAMPAIAEILPGLKTNIWGYNGIFPGPTILASRHRQAVVRQINNLPPFHPTLRYVPWSSLHLHGSPSLPEYDGYANDITSPGEYKDYVYPNIQEARTLWYHDHGVHHTAPNVYMGLAGQYHLHEASELALPIPHGRYDVPLVINDAIFDTSGQLIFDDNSESGLMGDVVLVNGTPWPVMNVERRKYRFRVLDASLSRSYGLQLAGGDPFTVIGTDGGLMAAPQTVSSLKIGMGERYEIVIDFAKYKVGQQIVLSNVSPKNNIDFATTGNVMAFKVVGEATDSANNAVPDVLNPDSPAMQLKASDATMTRRFAFERKHGEWTINGLVWADVINSDFQLTVANPALGDVEIWEFENRSGGWFHPIHVHLVDFQVLDRNGLPPFAYERGPKDLVYLGENELVRVITRFGPQIGRYMMHCHNTVHEDHDMMVQYRVGTGGHDPLSAAVAKPLPAPPL